MKLNESKTPLYCGFFDDEGAIFISKGKNQYFLCTSINHTNLPILESIEKLLGIDSVSKSHDKRLNPFPLFRIQFYYNEAKMFLEKTYPYLKIKKEQAKLAIEFQSKMKKGKLTL